MSGAGRWFRVNTTWSQSEWLAVLPPAARLAWIELLSHVKAHGYDGRVRATAPAVFGRMVGIDAADVSLLLDAAQEDGALQVQGGEWIITGWKEHQGDPTGKERLKRFREKRSEEDATQVTRFNRYATPTETETETKTTTAAGAAKGDPEFETAWADYPRRSGDNPKRRALKAWRARIHEKIPAAELVAGVQRYARYIRANSKEGSEFVMMASTFFGPDERWGEPWSPNGIGPPRVEAIIEDA